MPLSESEPSKIIVADVAGMFSNLQPIYEKLMKRRKIPEKARAFPISPQYHPALASLHQSLFHQIEPLEITERLRGTSRIVNYCQETSTILLLGDKVAGATFVLSKKNATTAYVYAVIIEAARRRSWATVFLKYHSLRRLRDAGIDEIAFQAFDDNPDTLRHAQKVGARIVADNYTWR